MPANNYDTRKDTIILYEGINGAEDAVETHTVDGKEEIRVFKNLRKAQKFAANHIDHKDHYRLGFANYDPVFGAGDRQETNNRKCLKCGGFLRLDLDKGQIRSKLPGGDVIAMDQYLCPQCDLGEV